MNYIRMKDTTTGEERLIPSPPRLWNLFDLFLRFRNWPLVALRSQPTRKLGFAGLAIIAGFCILFAVGLETYGTSLVMLYFALGLFISTSNDRIVVNSYLKKGFVFAEVDAESTKKALKKWRIDPNNPKSRTRPFSIGGVVFVSFFILLWISITVIGRGVVSSIALMTQIEKANGGDADAQLKLGYMFLLGKGGVKRDDAEAVKWFELAANQGNAEAEAEVSAALDNGDGVPQNSSAAFQWAQKSAIQGNAFGESILASMYLSGDGVIENDSKAFQMAQQAANQGNGFGEGVLSRIYLFGITVSQDYTQAFQWGQKAADQGDSSGEGTLAWTYLYGNGVPQDYSEAFQWAQKAASQDDGAGQFVLAKCYENGWGVAQDIAKGADLMQNSAAQGFQPAIDALKANSNKN